MRETKYKAWDKVFKRFVPVACLYFDESSNFIGVYMGDETEEEWTVVRKEHLELMEYTGLKDMNGVEIYEGDLLGGYSFVHNEEIKPRLGVYWSRGMWDCETFALGDINETCVVVGNIYENLELLEGRP